MTLLLFLDDAVVVAVIYVVIGVDVCVQGMWGEAAGPSTGQPTSSGAGKRHVAAPFPSRSLGPFVALTLHCRGCQPGSHTCKGRSHVSPPSLPDHATIDACVQLYTLILDVEVCVDCDVVDVVE